MATLRPFRALRPDPAKAPEVAAVPYDVVNTAEARALASGKPASFLHVSRSEIDLPDGTEPYADSVYSRAAENFARLKREAGFLKEQQPALYVYRLRMGDHVQTGVAGAASLAEYDTDIVRKHERTRRDKEDDRTRHMLALGAQTGPVFMTYRGRSEIDRLVERVLRDAPLYDFTAPDGVSHALWRATGRDAEELARQFEAVPLFYIADGHHRAASAARAREALRARSSSAGHAFFDDFLAVLFPADQVRILPYNRVVRDLDGDTPRGFLEALRGKFEVSEGAPASPERKGEISVYLDGAWHGLRVADGAAETGADGPIASLDVSLLQEKVLEPMLGIRDVRTDKRIDFVGGIRGTAELERLVSSGKAVVAFSMFPVSLEELTAISDAGEIMPPKSTWFEPKLRDGLLIHQIAEPA
ncbi:MAG: DUF1015 domain-containing protein [Thermoanaerobaculia bacterium]